MAILENPAIPVAAPAPSSGTHPSPAHHVQWNASLPYAALTYFTDDILEIVLDPDTRFSTSLVFGIVNEFSARCETRAGRVLIDISGITSMENDVARVFGQITASMRVALLGFGPADRVLARFFMRKLDSKNSCIYVEERQQALDFLYLP